MVRLKRIGIKQTAKFFAVFYFLISLVFVVPLSIFTFIAGSINQNSSGSYAGAFGGLFVLLLPLVYAGIGFVMVAISGFIYNQIAKRVGGIEFELDSETEKL